MSDENERSVASDGSVRQRLADRLGDLSDLFNATGHDYSDVLLDAANALRKPTLTDEERKFLQNLHGAYEEMANQTGYVNAAAQKEAREHAVLLKGLLEKHK